MTDKLISRGWWLATMSLIAFTAACALWSAYHGVFQSLAGNFAPGAISLLGCCGLGIACYLICRHRGDLVVD